jgi:glycosyltransferase involved in cell wall biosynthesis
MHIAVNAWFWNRPDTGSGQYVRCLVETLRRSAPDVRITLIAPHGWAIDPPEGAAVEFAPGSGSGDGAKLRFEQCLFPRTAQQVGAALAHVPYWGGPLSSPIPTVVTIHDLIPMLLPEYRGGVLARAYMALVAASARGAQAIITDSRASAEDIYKQLSIPADQIYPIPLAAGREYSPQPNLILDLAIRKKYNLPTEFVLYLGGYDSRKNVHTLVKAFTYVKTGYDIPLVLAGRLPAQRSPRFIDIQQAIDSMNMRDTVQIIGEVDEADKPSIYRLARTFVFPSRYEGFGLPVLEAMACGKPVVTSDRSSLPEIVGDAGFTVDPDDARHMAGSILATLNDEPLAKELSQRAIQRAAEFSWERTAAETMAVYGKVLSDTV